MIGKQELKFSYIYVCTVSEGTSLNTDLICGNAILAVPLIKMETFPFLLIHTNACCSVITNIWNILN